MKEINCNIIEDLIPLYKEGLCNADTALLVEEHLKSCDNCRKLAEDISAEKSTENVEIPEESKVFSKVSRKMKRSKLKTAILSLVLLAVLGGLGFLTFGQVTHKDGFISFETLVQSLETRKIAKYIAKGDMDAYADSITFGTNFDANFNILRNMDEIRSQNKQALNEAYDKYMSGKKVKHVLSFAQYLEGNLTGNANDSKSSMIQNTARIMYEDGSEMILELVKSYDGKYLCEFAYSGIEGSNDADESIEKMAKIINYANIPQFFPDGLADVLFKKYNKDYFVEHPDYEHFLMRNWFKEEYQEQVNSGMLSYYKEKGFTFDKFINSEIRYDKEKKLFYYDFMFEGCDDKGKAVMTAKVYSTPEGLIPPAKEDIEILPDGCSEELVNCLTNFFG